MATPIDEDFPLGSSFVGRTSQAHRRSMREARRVARFREAKDTRSKQTRERLHACRETSDVCVCPEKGAGQT
jgi:hypothetical protein